MLLVQSQLDLLVFLPYEYNNQTTVTYQTVSFIDKFIFDNTCLGALILG